MRWAILAVAAIACAREAAPAKVHAADFLALTDQPAGELPALAYTPAHTDDEYVAIPDTAIPLRFYIEPLNDQALATRLAAVRGDFASVLGRTITDEEAARWQRDTLEDFRRRRVAARALLDLHLAGTLPLKQLQLRFTALQSGLDLAFARITGITPDEHARLMAGP